ncbi:MAG: FAD-dependent thymidylate synthase [Candidatus Harrisonbacteria bacterium]|nr:FAD-dependent thymidylate synthase [Candidatus Harrisonbacteria bacterium]
MDNEKLPEQIQNKEKKTLRPVNPGAEKWLNRPVKCLDHGFVYLVDYLGDDSAIAQAARVSYGQGTKKVSEDRGLIRYLMRHRHTTPFEMCELKFHCKMPIFVARQWIRHRTANVNEYSGRYSEMSDEFYLPNSAVLRKQSQGNKQGRSEEKLTSEQQAKVLQLFKEDYERQYKNYQESLNLGLTRELARIGLSVANYTQWYWKIDLHNLFHFLNLRLDNHAQYEIRVYGEAMARIVKDAFPLAYEAFEDYRLNAGNFSGPELKLLRLLAKRWPIDKSSAREIASINFRNKRETEEFLKKIDMLGLFV